MAEMENWNLDREVDPPTMVRGMMGKDSTGNWQYMKVSADGSTLPESPDAGKFRVSALGVNIADVSNSDAGDFRVSAIVDYGSISAKSADANQLHVSAVQNNAALMRTSSFAFITNHANIDAFGRLRTSTPTTLFDSKLLQDESPLFWNTVISSDGATPFATSAYASDAVTMSVVSAGDYVVRQTYQAFNYQPGKSQLIVMTGIMAKEAGVTKSIGYFDATTTHPHSDNKDGYWFGNDGTDVTVNIGLNGTINTKKQSEWNVDKLDGTGTSGINLDFTKNQIMFINFEWLGVGSVWFGFFVNGEAHICHRFDHANSTTGVYALSPNKPLRYEVRSVSGAGSLVSICGSVMSEGGVESNGIVRSTNSGRVDADVVGTEYALIGIQLKSTATDRTVDIEGINLLNATASDVVLWQLKLNPTVAGTFTYNAQTNSFVNIATGATANTVTGGTVLASGYFVSNLPAQTIVNTARKLGSSIAGASDSIVLCATPVVGTNQDIYATLTWRENS